MVKLTELELPEGNGALPDAAAKLTTQNLVALAWGSISPEISKLTVEELHNVTDALQDAYSGMVVNGEVAEGSCCCCCPCCCCSGREVR